MERVNRLDARKCFKKDIVGHAPSYQGTTSSVVAKASSIDST